MKLQEEARPSFPEKQPTFFMKPLKKFKNLSRGLVLTLILAIVASQIAKLPFFSIIGIMLISILLGMSWKSLMGVQANAQAGITFSSKLLLRAGIILMGVRLNLSQILDAGLSIILIDAIVIAFTLVVMMALGKWFNVNKHLSALIAVGTAVCGAAAIAAVAPIVKGKKEHTALAVACISLIGTVGALAYILIYPLLNMDPYSYGVLVGATLQELAHVVAAGVPGGDVGSSTAILVKLGRVAYLIPVALVFSLLFSRRSVKKEKTKLKNLPIPWFILGFLAMSVINTLHWLSPSFTSALIVLSVYLMSMGMAGLGLSISFSDFKKLGLRPIFVGVLGAAALSALGVCLLNLL